MVEGARAKAGGDAGSEDDRRASRAAGLRRGDAEHSDHERKVEANLVEDAAQFRFRRTGRRDHVHESTATVV
jgi:hypothetical protein